MNTFCVYPIPLDSAEIWAEFAPAVRRFAHTWREFPPMADCKLMLVANNADPKGVERDIFKDLDVEWVRYDGAGCDAGSWQLAASLIHGFQVNFTSRCYFHRTGWLKRLVDAREFGGPGLYGTSASHEGGRWHVCLRAWGIDSEDFREYPVKLDSRDRGVAFEVGNGEEPGSLTKWMALRKKMPTLVYFDSVHGQLTWDSPDKIFRRGDQSNLLVFDKHSEEYEKADEPEKLRLEGLCFGVDPTAKRA